MDYSVDRMKKIFDKVTRGFNAQEVLLMESIIENAIFPCHDAIAEEVMRFGLLPDKMPKYGFPAVEVLKEIILVINEEMAKSIRKELNEDPTLN